MSVAEYCQIVLGISYLRSRSDLDQLGLHTIDKQTRMFLDLPRSAETKIAIDPKWTDSVFNTLTRSYDGAIRVCPLCLEERRYGQRFWRSRFAAACPTHGCRMVSTCAECGINLPYFGKVAGIGRLHWLESWPNCPHCLKKAYDHVLPADQKLVALSRKWHMALFGLKPFPKVTPDQFLGSSRRLLVRFATKPDLIAARTLSCPNKIPSPIEATAIVLAKFFSNSVSLVTTQAALGMPVDSLTLAKEMVS